MIDNTGFLLEILRNRGWSVAVHNDYCQSGEAMTFYLFTHPSGVWAKGEGSTDERALREVDRQAQERETWLRQTDGMNRGGR